MKLNRAIHREAAYAPMRAVVANALKATDPETRQLVLGSAVLKELDPDLLTRVTGDPAKVQLLSRAVRQYLPVRVGPSGALNYDAFTREALLELAVEEQQEALLLQTSRAAAEYYADQSTAVADPLLSRQHQMRALYYAILAEPAAGFAGWQAAWQALPPTRTALDDKAALIQVAEQSWPDLEEVAGAWVDVLTKKGWLAYNLDDWGTAAETFYRILADERLRDLGPLIYRSGQPTTLVDGRVDRLAEGETNVGLGYTLLRQGALSLAARRFERATRLVGRQLAGTDDEAAFVRARALIGLGEACTEMGAPDEMVLRRLLLPLEERRPTLHEYAASRAVPSLADLALGRLLNDAERFFREALDTLPEDKPGYNHLLRTEARLARITLERGDWQTAATEFERLRQLELSRDGSSLDDPDPGTLGDDSRLANRLAWINLYLGDCQLLAAGAPDLPASGAASRQNLEGTISTFFLPDQSAAPASGWPAMTVATAGGHEAIAAARRTYRLAWSLWKQARLRSGMALALRRQGDLAALYFAEPERRRRALERYEASLNLYEQTGNPTELSVTQERIELLRERARQLATAGPAELLTLPELSAPPKPADRPGRAASPDDAVIQFIGRTERALAGRRRYFRYRFAHKLVRWLGRSYRVIVGVSGFWLGALAIWSLWWLLPWLRQTSRVVTGYGWALPVLLNAFVIALAISVADRWTAIRRLAVQLIPRQLFWLSQDRLAVDELGLYHYDDADRLERLLLWSEIEAVRTQIWQRAWQRFWGREVYRGWDTAVFAPKGQVIRFDHELRGYFRLLQYIKRHLARHGRGDRWHEPRETLLHGNSLLLLLGLLMVAVYLSFGLTIAFVVLRPLARFGPPTFALATAAVALLVAILLVVKVREWRYMHPHFVRRALAYLRARRQTGQARQEGDS